jgi:hypothetical protein
MADEILPPTRRDRLATERRSWRRRLFVVLAAVAFVAGALGAAFALADDDSAPRAATTSASSRPGATVTSQPSEEIGPAADEVSELPEGRPLSHDDPLRLWIGGDSLAGGMGPVVGEYAEASGVVRAVIDFKVSSGLASSARDWPEHADGAIEEYDPEAIVFMVGTNDASVVSDERADWEPDYRAKVTAMMDQLSGGDAHRTVFWIGAPPMRTDWREEGVVEINRVFEEEALLRPDVVFVDGYKMFEGPEGGYSSTIFIPGTGQVRVRNGDGVHFTPAGAQWIGYNVWRLVDQRWDVGAYAEPDLPIDYHTEPGGNDGCCDDPGDGTGGTDDTEAPVDTTTTLSCESAIDCTTTTSSGGETTTTAGAPTTTPPTTTPPTTAPPTTPTT